MRGSEHEDAGARIPAGAHAVLASRDAIALGSALVSHVAAQSGVRALVIKGLTAEQLGLREPRAYADIDVLVDPASFDELVAALDVYGWRERVHLWMFDHIDEHSMTLINQSWPVDIDLHRYFPGFLLPPQDVFDVLWEHRTTFTIAQRPVIGADRVAGAAILALHALRYMHSGRNVSELAYLVGQVKAEEGAGAELAQLAADTESSETMRSVFRELGVVAPPGPPVAPQALKAWRRRVSHPSRTGQWFSHLQALPLRRWPAELRAVVWPPAELFLQEHIEVPNRPSALFLARLKRLRIGLFGLPRVIAAGLRRE